MKNLLVLFGLVISVNAMSNVGKTTCETDLMHLSYDHTSKTFSATYVEDGINYRDSAKVRTQKLKSTSSEGTDVLNMLNSDLTENSLTKNEMKLVKNIELIAGHLKIAGSAVGLIKLYGVNNMLISKFLSSESGFISRCK